ncbi:MAG TPA: NADH-quinone oxidoreductase subunit N [bacterium]
MGASFSAINLEVGLTILAAVVLGVGMVSPKGRNGRAETLLAAAGFGLLFAGTFAGLSPLGEAFGGAWGTGPLSVLYKRLFLAAGALTALLACPGDEPQPPIPASRLGEAMGLMTLSVTGMCVLVSSRELALLYTGLELVTMPLVAMVAIHPRRPQAAEAGLKYVFTSALSSGFLLYGLSFVYGLTGSTMLATIAQRLPAGPLTVAALVMVMVGVGFKISAVPFHLWAPDVYQGGPVVVSVFLAVASKAAGFALFAKAVALAFTQIGESVALLVAVLAVLTMSIANLVTLYQTNIKRFLAWSSVAQCGYLLVGLAARGVRADASVAFYLLVYLASSLAAFGVATIVERATGREDMREYIGLSESNPRIAFVMMLALFSLAGIPPLAGFLGKFFLFAAAAQVGKNWLVLVAAVNSTVSLYYYLTVIRWMYIEKPKEGSTPVPAIPVSAASGAVLAISTIGMLALGLLPQFLRWVESASASGF